MGGLDEGLAGLEGGKGPSNNFGLLGSRWCFGLSVVSSFGSDEGVVYVLSSALASRSIWNGFVPVGESALVGVSSKRCIPLGRLDTPRESARGGIVAIGDWLFLLVVLSG